MNITVKYKEQLDKVRQDLSLLDNYKFISPDNSKHFERLRLNIALYNDLKQTDYEIARFLFNEEFKWRKNPQDGEVDNLYFSAFILTRFNNPEIVWQFFDTKNIDFDSGIGFDGEYLVSTGIKETYEYVYKSEQPLKSKVLELIGESYEKCFYTQNEIDKWIEYKKIYFKCYTYPIMDESLFLYSVNEKELFLSTLQTWIKKQNDWSYDKLGLFRTFAKYSGDKDLEIKALKLTLEKNDKEFLTDVYKRELAGVYIEIGDFEPSYNLLKTIIDETDNGNVVRGCVELLCKIIKNNKTNDYEIPQKSFNVIINAKRKYGHFSPYVDELIIEVKKLIRTKEITAHNKYRSFGRWFKFWK
jgi:hypothetical protein